MFNSFLLILIHWYTNLLRIPTNKKLKYESAYSLFIMVTLLQCLIKVNLNIVYIVKKLGPCYFKSRFQIKRYHCDKSI